MVWWGMVGNCEVKESETTLGRLVDKQGLVLRGTWSLTFFVPLKLGWKNIGLASFEVLLT